jgi:simple sugar transport system ATP-binding protein
MSGSQAAVASAATPAAEATGIHKQFGSTQALRGVDLTLWPGRCLGLVGRNGAGKSTLVSILSGIYPADRGEVRFDGNPAPATGAGGGWRRHIATVYQHSMVVPGLTVAENVFLGRQPGRSGLVDWRRMREAAGQVMSEWGFPIDVRLPCADLTVEQRQIVEIARALAAGTQCLLLDEPTAALERAAIERLFTRVRQLVASGVAVLYISHHLEEVFEICQDVAVIRDGELVLTGATSDLTKDGLVTAMVGPAGGTGPAGRRAASSPAEGRPTGAGAATTDASATGAAGTGTAHAGADAADAVAGSPAQPAARSAAGAPALVVEHVSADSPGGRVRDVSLTVRPGERVGVTGLLSAGVSTLARIVAGAAPHRSGQVLVNGRPVTAARRDLSLLAGVGYIPEDRQADGFVPLLGVAENATMTITGWLARLAGFVRPAARTAAASPLARRLSIVSAGLGQPVGELSGGNQQKVTVARALASKPRLIVAITPTRGVDVASKSLLLSELAGVTEQTGAGLLLASDELDDLTICDRVIVLVRGERFAEFSGPHYDREALIAASEGIARHAAGSAPTDSDRQGPS